MATTTTILIIDKTGTPKILSVKDYKQDDLYKKCGFKKPDGLEKRHTWAVRCEKIQYRISVFAKDDGNANMENKFEFPPPMDNCLFFGSCAVIVEMRNVSGVYCFAEVSLKLWDKLYEKLFGGFESLTLSAKDDEEETDELESVLKQKKTANGYLKDGFVVDSDKEDDDLEYSDEDEDNAKEEEEEDVVGDGLEMDDIGSELSEESYTYEKGV